MLQPFIDCVITHIEEETPNTKRFYFEVPSLENFDFKPGQFVTFDLPIHEQKNKRWRSYSIASWPDGTNAFELVIVRLEGGMGTSWLWENAEEGTVISFRGPQGKFVLHENIDEDLYLICTGTGIAPFRSMLFDLYKRKVAHKNIYLIFGCRKFADTLYGTDMRNLQQRLPGFHFYPTYSREVPGNHLLLRTGYVHHVYEELIAKRARTNEQDGGEGLMPAKFFLCGWKNMIDDARKKIVALGYDKKDIHFELYG